MQDEVSDVGIPSSPVFAGASPRLCAMYIPTSDPTLFNVAVIRPSLRSPVSTADPQSREEAQTVSNQVTFSAPLFRGAGRNKARHAGTRFAGSVLHDMIATGGEEEGKKQGFDAEGCHRIWRRAYHVNKAFK